MQSGHGSTRADMAGLREWILDRLKRLDSAPSKVYTRCSPKAVEAIMEREGCDENTAREKATKVVECAWNEKPVFSFSPPSPATTAGQRVFEQERISEPGKLWVAQDNAQKRKFLTEGQARRVVPEDNQVNIPGGGARAKFGKTTIPYLEQARIVMGYDTNSQTITGMFGVSIQTIARYLEHLEQDIEVKQERTERRIKAKTVRKEKQAEQRKISHMIEKSFKFRQLVDMII